MYFYGPYADNPDELLRSNDDSDESNKKSASEGVEGKKEDVSVGGKKEDVSVGGKSNDSDDKDNPKASKK